MRYEKAPPPGMLSSSNSEADPAAVPQRWWAVVLAADAFWRASRAEPDDVEAWWPALHALDEALARCPGTAAYVAGETLTLGE